MKGHLVDIHCHTREHSYDGKASAIEVVTGLLRCGFAGVIFTDHNYVWPPDELEELRAHAGLPADFVLLSGQEVRTSVKGLMAGDLLVYGPGRAFPDGTEATEVFEEVEDTGGFCIAPHPAVPLIGFGSHISAFPVAAVEVWNGRHGEKANAAARALAQEAGLPATGGSDTHRVEDIGGGGTVFPRVPETLEDLHGMIANREGRPWHPGMLAAARQWVQKIRKPG